MFFLNHVLSILYTIALYIYNYIYSVQRTYDPLLTAHREKTLSSRHIGLERHIQSSGCSLLVRYSLLDSLTFATPLWPSLRVGAKVVL